MYASVKSTEVKLSKDIFPVEAWELLSNDRKGDDLVIIDVSTPQEYENLHLEGAIHVYIRWWNLVYNSLKEGSHVGTRIFMIQS